jgi:5-methyltetrahydrofolate--homocysteine methyltransferase
MVERNKEALLALARRHLACGADGLAVNLGPGRAMAELTPWVTETLREELATPLFLSASGLAFPELLRRHGRHLTINAVTADPAALPGALTAAKEGGTGLVVLLVRPGLTPAGSADRLAVAAEVVDQALRIGFPLQHLYLDPLLTLRPDPMAWRISRGLPDIGPVAETILQLRQLDDNLRTIVALGNCARGADKSGRAGTQARVLAVLVEAGLDAVIVNGQDPALLQACKDLAGGNHPAETVSRAA